MNRLTRVVLSTCRSRRAQILLPAVMLAPIFILVIYLLFETSKLSMTKVRQQFALDNAAYSAMSATSGYLNALAQINGPLPYRVMKTMSYTLPPKATAENPRKDLTVFDIFYSAGAFPAIGPSHELGRGGAIANKIPAAASEDWNMQYYKGQRSSWMKEDPQDKPEEEGYYVMTDKTLADNYFFGASGIALQTIKEYATVFVRTGSIYASQTYSYKDTVKNARMFRESYALNTNDCRKTECGKQSGSTLDRFELDSKPFEIGKARFYVTADFQGSTAHSGAYPLDLDMKSIIKSDLFQFAYLTPSSRSRLRQLAHGVVLKQKFSLPANRFNINVTQRYEPYVRNTVSVSCPRSNNNCVWPNPISKYSVRLAP